MSTNSSMKAGKGGKRWKSEAGHLALEIILILAAVLIFRSLWLLMDEIPLLSRTLPLVMMLVIGIIVTVVSFELIFRHDH
ncbi:hypothetical protein KY308_01340 [Candidatus Woesearchaeota archaeon]|nr:hypothetical protein [Candidatus Woesearchaeota archaeon]